MIVADHILFLLESMTVPVNVLLVKNTADRLNVSFYISKNLIEIIPFDKTA